jgi:hypothetical protein
MKRRLIWILPVVVLSCVVVVVAAKRSRGAQPPQAEIPRITVSGSRIVVHYPAENRFYSYTELGGNCVFAYRLTTPGGPIERENCR